MEQQQIPGLFIPSDAVRQRANVPEYDSLYKFSIDNEEKYSRVKDFLNNYEGLSKIYEKEDLIVYGYINKDHEGFVVLDGLNDLDVEVRTTKNIDRKIKKSLEKISEGKFK